MAIKRLRLNDEGEFEERELEKSELPPPPPKPAPKKRTRAPRIGSSGGTAKGSPAAPSSRVKVTKRATKTYATGKTALDHDVVRFQCERCGSSRVGSEDTKSMTCGLCSTPMKRLR